MENLQAAKTTGALAKFRLTAQLIAKVSDAPRWSEL